MSDSSSVLHRAATSSHPHATNFILHRQKAPQTPPPPAVSVADIPNTVARYHSHAARPNQCSSVISQEIRAPIDAVWSVVRRFESPQSYKHFVKSCDLLNDDGSSAVAVGCLRRVHIISGLPAATSLERLEILDDDHHVISFSVVGGDHRLSNYRSVTSLHRVDEGRTTVVESYVVHTPPGNTQEETCLFVDTIVRCNLQSLAQIAQNNLARREKNKEKSQSIARDFQ